MIKASELRKGKVVAYEGQLYTVHTVTHVTRGNWRSYIQAKFKNLKTGLVIDARLGVDDVLETPFIEKKPFEYLYRDGTDYVLMDQTNYDQITVPVDVMGEADKYLKGNEIVACSFIDGKIVDVELPNVVELKVVDTTPVMKGATATNQTKDAVLETGLRVRVPPFVENGTVLRIDTRTCEYIERAKG